MKFVFLNGEFVPESEAKISVFDRGFLYGDGLFETMRVYEGKIFTWNLHFERLQRGAEFLKIKVPLSSAELQNSADALIERNALPDSVLRLQVTRGPGVRGYSISGANQPTLLLSMHPAPSLSASAPLRWRLITSATRLQASDPLAPFKTANKLPQILSRSEAEGKGADDALLLNDRDGVAETSTCNLFCVRGESVYTPPANAGILPGITRQLVFELCAKLKLKCIEQNLQRRDLAGADGIFVTSSVLEIVEVIEIDGKPARVSPLTRKIFDAYRGFRM